MVYDVDLTLSNLKAPVLLFAGGLPMLGLGFLKPCYTIAVDTCVKYKWKFRCVAEFLLSLWAQAFCVR